MIFFVEIWIKFFLLFIFLFDMRCSFFKLKKLNCVIFLPCSGTKTRNDTIALGQSSVCVKERIDQSIRSETIGLHLQACYAYFRSKT